MKRISKNTMEKKNFFAPWALELGATRRAAMLLLVMMLTTATAWAQIESGSCGDNLTWELNGNTLTISGTGDMEDYDDSDAPWYSICEEITTVVIGAGVTSIGNYAFSDCNSLGSVTFAEGSHLESIGEYAFNGTALTSIEIPASVTSIGEGVFEYCENLATITVEDGNKVYDSRNGCNAIIETSSNKLIAGCKNTTIPASVTSIGDYAFLDCSGLTSVTIPASVTSIGEYAFCSCTGLISVIVNATTPPTLGESAFEYNYDDVDDNAKDRKIYVPTASKESYKSAWRTYESDIMAFKTERSGSCGTDVTWKLTGIPDNYTLTISGTGAMNDRPWTNYANGIKTVVIGNGVTSIGDYAFSGCSGLTSVEIPASVTSIGTRAFFGCSGLTSIEIPANVTSIGQSAFNRCSGLTSVTIPASVTSIGDYVFNDCSNLATMTVADGNTAYDSRNGCNAIIEKSTNTLIIGCNNSTIPASVTSIGEDAFYGCSGLTSITIPAGVTSIGNYAFSGTGLTSVEIPASVTSIGDYAFSGCSGLATVTVYAPSCTLGFNAFSACSNLENIYVFSDKVASYQAAWSAYANKITGITGGYCGATDHERDVVWELTGSTLTIRGEGAMYDYDLEVNPTPWSSYADQINEVVIGNGVTSIGNFAFSKTAMTSINISASVTSIGVSAFFECEYLTSVTFAEGSRLESIGNDAFDDTGLTSIEIPASVTSIGVSAFFECESLTSVTFAEGSQLESIGNNAFQNCHNLTSITIPASVTSIGKGVFEYCENLATITVEDGNKVYDSRNGCNAIIETSSNKLIAGCKNTTIPASVTSIGVRAFLNCCNLTSITIPASVTSIGGRAFLNCNNLATVTVYAPSCSLGEDAFANCFNLANIYVFSNLVDTYKDAENWSSYEDKIKGMVSGYCGTTNHETDVVWALTGESTNYTLTISGTGAMADYDDPSEQPWYNCNGIETIVIENGVTSIGDNAFDGPDPTTVTIPASVTSIGAAAFGGCKDLSMVTFAPGSQLTTIGEGAFSNCESLGSITIPASVTSIGKEVFGFCGNLSTITVEDGNKVYDSRNGCNAIIETSSNKLIAGCKNSIIPASVTSIGDDAFYGCSGLTSITIPAGVTSIGYFAFDKCNYLSNVTFVGTPTLTTIGENAFSSTGLTTITIPASVTSIGSSAFHNCQWLTSVTFAEGSQLTTIGWGAFRITGLTSITIPASVTSIGDYAFEECSNLNSVMLNGEATIGGNAFPNGATVTIAEGMLLHNGTEPLSGNVSDMGKLNGKTLKTAYSVTFDIADDDDDPEAQIVVRGNKATVPTVARTGYTLKWKLNEEDYDFDTPVNSNIALTAVWTANNYTVQFSANGGSGVAMASMQLTYDGDVAMLPACTYTAPVGKAFKNWNTAADGSGTSYDDERWVRNLTDEPNGTVVLYAQWGKNIATCTATVPGQTLDSYSYIFYKFESANGGNVDTGTTVYDGETLLTVGTDYKFDQVYFYGTENSSTYVTNKVGDHFTVVIKGIGNYAGTTTADFYIVSPEANGTWGDLAWTIDADGDFTISKKDGVEGNVAMKETTKGKYPWYDKAGYIKTITIGEGITSVAANAFCREMEMNVYGNVNALHLPSTLTTIGEYAFAYCTGLTVELKDFAGITYPANAFTQVGCVVGTLLDNANNANTISVMAQASKNDVTLTGRTLYKDGDWNTLCLPFDVSEGNSILDGATVKELDVEKYYDANGEFYTELDYENAFRTGFDAETGTLRLYFKNVEADGSGVVLQAGTPYLIKWDKAEGYDDADPTTRDITGDHVFLNAKLLSLPKNAISYDHNVTFIGNYSPVELTGGDASNLYLGAANQLYWPTADRTINAFRGYFHVNLGGAGQVRSIRLNLGDKVTGVTLIDNGQLTIDNYAGADSWYDLQGRKLSGKPTQKGVYIYKGKKVVIDF